MKKCKITLAPKAKKRFFYLAPEAEMLYFLAITKNKKRVKTLLKSHPDIEAISLSPGQWIEVEWTGCQNINDGVETIRLNCVRIAKASKLSSKNDHDALISVHFGWMYGEDLRFINHRKSGMKVKMLDAIDEQFDFSELFHDNETLEDMLSKLENRMIN